MDDDLRELYQETILEHGRRPRNQRELSDANRTAEGYNPLCGDKIHLDLRVKDGTIEAVAFHGSGCAISTASASMMTECVAGRGEEEVRKLSRGFRDMVMGKADAPEGVDLGKLTVFSGVREFPVRVKCATLAWHTLQAALDDADKPVSTE